MKDELKEIAIELYNIGAVKYGDFVVKSGLSSPIYIDFRIIVSYPKLLLRISKSLLNLVNLSEFNNICGVPYTALPIATAISTENDIPMLIRRKEAKSYGTKKIIEGVFKPGDKSLIIEDIITSGLSILETANDLKKVGLNVTNAVIIVDREQRGKENLNQNGIEVKSLFKLSELMNLLLEAGKLDQKSVNIVLDYIKSVSAPLKIDDRLTLDFSSRAKIAKNPMSARLLNLMDEKQSNLCLAADFIKSEEILELAEISGEHIAVLKIHVDILEDFNKNFVAKLKSLAKKYNFMIMEDRKFADIGQIVSYQYRNGLYNIVEWADFITVHIIPGSGIIKGIEEGLDGILENRGIFIVAQMSSEGALTSEDYVQASVSAAKDSGIVSGFVCQKNISSDPGHIQVTPGVKLNKSKDSLGQQYNTPQVVVDSGADLVVVGRGITHAKDQLAAVLEYKKVLWEAYENRKSKLVV